MVNRPVIDALFDKVVRILSSYDGDTWSALSEVRNMLNEVEEIEATEWFLHEPAYELRDTKTLDDVKQLAAVYESEACNDGGAVVLVGIVKELLRQRKEVFEMDELV